MIASSPQTGPADSIIKPEHLGDLAWDPELGVSLVFSRLSLNGLVLDPSVISKYRLIQKLSLTDCNISDVGFLNSLPYLSHLNLERNKLTAFPLMNLTRLQELDLTSNQIMSINGISTAAFSKSLKSLHIDKNLIRSLDDMYKLDNLQVLTISHNGLRSLRGLSPSLTRIDARNNRIESLDGLIETDLKVLRELLLGNNYLSDISPFPNLPQLNYLDLSRNNLDSIDCIARLQQLACLRSLDILDNPLGVDFASPSPDIPALMRSQDPAELHRLSVISMLPALLKFNGVVITIEDKLAAEHTFTPSSDYVDIIKRSLKKLNIAKRPARYIALEERWYGKLCPLVLVGPNGAGKRTLTQKICEKYPQFKFCPSHTTRKAKPGERDGINYFFVGRETLKQYIGDGEAIQHVNFFGELYALLFRTVWNTVVHGHIPILDVEIEGLLEMKQLDGFPVKVIYVTAPSTQELDTRIGERLAQDKLNLQSAIKHDQQVKADLKRQHSKDIIETYQQRKAASLLNTLPVLQRTSGTTVVIPSLESAIAAELECDFEGNTKRNGDQVTTEQDRVVDDWLKRNGATQQQWALNKQRQELYNTYSSKVGFFDKTVVNADIANTFAQIDEFIAENYNL
eukprot:Partr_v1_DN27053_c0_g1_i5_m29068 putative leucine-rich repeats and guanylate kinase domain containing